MLYSWGSLVEGHQFGPFINVQASQCQETDSSCSEVTSSLLAWTAASRGRHVVLKESVKIARVRFAIHDVQDKNHNLLWFSGYTPVKAAVTNRSHELCSCPTRRLLLLWCLHCREVGASRLLAPVPVEALGWSNSSAEAATLDPTSRAQQTRSADCPPFLWTLTQGLGSAAAGLVVVADTRSGESSWCLGSWAVGLLLARFFCQRPTSWTTQAPAGFLRRAPAEAWRSAWFHEAFEAGLSLHGAAVAEAVADVAARPAVSAKPGFP